MTGIGWTNSPSLPVVNESHDELGLLRSVGTHKAPWCFRAGTSACGDAWGYRLACDAKSPNNRKPRKSGALYALITEDADCTRSQLRQQFRCLLWPSELSSTDLKLNSMFRNVLVEPQS